METKDRKSFADIVIGFAELKGKELSTAALELYWNAMQEWNIENFRAAASYLIRTCTFMPTPKDFEDLRNASRLTSGEAWTLAIRHAASSAYRDGLIGNALIDKAVEVMGGYTALALTDMGKLQHMERRFCEHYDELQRVNFIRSNLPSIARDKAIEDDLKPLSEVIRKGGKING